MPNINSFVGNPLTTPRRSQRLLLLHNHTTPNPKSTKKPSIQSINCTVGLRRSPRLNEEVASLKRSPRFSNHKSPKKEHKSVGKLSKISSRDSARANRREGKTKENSRVIEEEITVESGGKGKSRNEERIDVGEKRKCGGQKIAKRWTKDQELALRTAYFIAKPNPHFWKNISKPVPGKSQQDCFDRIHRDFMTLPQSQPRSRAKTINSSPLHQFSISASKLLKPIEKKGGRSNFLKPKSYITQKTIEKNGNIGNMVIKYHYGLKIGLKEAKNVKHGLFMLSTAFAC